jgi:hypothetical protein
MSTQSPTPQTEPVATAVDPDTGETLYHDPKTGKPYRIDGDGNRRPAKDDGWTGDLNDLD